MEDYDVSRARTHSLLPSTLLRHSLGYDRRFSNCFCNSRDDGYMALVASSRVNSAVRYRGRTSTAIGERLNRWSDSTTETQVHLLTTDKIRGLIRRTPKRHGRIQNIR